MRNESLGYRDRYITFIDFLPLFMFYTLPIFAYDFSSQIILLK